jgi:hypothetical protein
LKPGDWYDSVGSSPFDPNNTVDIATFCTDTKENSTDCAQQWIQAGHNQGKHLYASGGVYTLSKSLFVFDGMHLRCESPSTVIFRKKSGLSYPQFRTDPNSTEPVTDVSIENCGFDMNGDRKNFAAAVVMVGADHVTFRGNRIFDTSAVVENLECFDPSM